MEPHSPGGVNQTPLGVWADTLSPQRESVLVRILRLCSPRRRVCPDGNSKRMKGNNMLPCFLVYTHPTQNCRHFLKNSEGSLLCLVVSGVPPPSGDLSLTTFPPLCTTNDAHHLLAGQIPIHPNPTLLHVCHWWSIPGCHGSISDDKSLTTPPLLVVCRGPQDFDLPRQRDRFLETDG